LRHLFGDFEVIATRVGGGPTSGLLWVLQEWIALVFSFGNSRLYRLLVPLTWILSPLKYLDLLLCHHPDAPVVACVHFIEVRKPVRGDTKTAPDSLRSRPLSPAEPPR
jgi:hypothetical protein